MTAGKLLAAGFVVGTAVFAVALWYFQVYAFYEEVPQENIEIQGVSYETVAWEGIDAFGRPLKRRVCLSVTPETARQIADAHEELSGLTPLIAPYWFDCFDARQIGTDLEGGLAAGYRMGPSGYQGVDSYMALYEDGRAFIWRQLDERYAR